MKKIENLLPASLHRRILHSKLADRYRARRLALTGKRLDLCAAQMAHLFHCGSVAGIEGKRCLEFGAGWVLSHSLTMYLLGAKEVIATDLFPIASPKNLRQAIHAAERSVVQDVLAPFSEHARVRDRLNRLLSIRNFSFESLRALGITYLSPVDLSTPPIDLEVDFIFSLSVLEHVLLGDIAPLLTNLGEMLECGGSMINCIHLEDHRDIVEKPFAFLGLTQDQWPSDQASRYGNRVRASKWQGLFGAVQDTNSAPIYRYHRRDRPLPQRIDSSVSYEDEEDLRCSHVGILTKKRSPSYA